jgi:alpha-D-xyloside xylohydrolase
VDFTVPGGVKCRLTSEGSQMWRLRTARGDGTFAEVGAVQALARWMGEPMPGGSRPLREEANGDGVHVFTAPDGSKAVLTKDGSSLCFLSATGRKVVEVVRLAPDGKESVLAGRLLPREAVYGLGERLDRLNKRGTRVMLYTCDGYNDSSASYVAIPLFSTTRGGGVFVNAYERMTADFGAADADEWRMEIAKDSIDAYIIATDRIGDVPGRYMDLSGHPSVPDVWQFGPVICRQAPDFAVFDGPTTRRKHGHLTLGMGLKNIVEKYRAMGALPTAVVAEGRSCEIFGMTPEEQARNRAEFSKGPDYLAKDGIRYMIYMYVGSTVLRSAPGFRSEYEVSVTVTDAAGKVKGKRTSVIPFVTFTSGNPDVSRHHKGIRYLDITDPEAWQWYLDNVWQPLLDCGVRGAKIDFCEEMPEDGALYGDTRFRYHWKHPEVFDGASIHHAYPTFFIAKLCRDLTARLQARGQGSFMALSRGGGIGAQRAPFLWAGDQQRAFDKLDDHVFAMLNAGMSGVPFMTYDMSCYHYTSPVQTPVAVHNRKTGAIDLSRTVHAGQDEEAVYRRYSRNLPIDAEQRLFLRGLEFTTYSPCIQTHGYVRHPFEFDDATRALYVKYAARHKSLAGEIAAASRKAAQTGVPVVRPLVWDYQDDEHTWDISDEYIFCDRYLIAPVLKDATSREIYLPQGVWTEDFGEHHRHEVPAGGKRFTMEVPVGFIPVFVRQRRNIRGNPHAVSGAGFATGANSSGCVPTRAASGDIDSAPQ